ncbi:hypothetical protein ACFQZ4_02815 [Catellatospora coxensis]
MATSSTTRTATTATTCACASSSPCCANRASRCSSWWTTRNSPSARTGVRLGRRARAPRGRAAASSGPNPAADWAADQVAGVRDDPLRRIALLARTYHGPEGPPRHLPFRRAAMSFMRWQARRGVLNSLSSQPPGSRWWRAVNDRLLYDGCEAMARSGGVPGEPSSPAVVLWTAFIHHPTARNWYRAHNASIVSGYLDNRELAEQEPMPERFFLNVALLRVLYTHALVAAPKLALAGSRCWAGSSGTRGWAWPGCSCRWAGSCPTATRRRRNCAPTSPTSTASAGCSTTA